MVRSVTDQTAGLAKFAAVIDGGHAVASRKGDELRATEKEKRVGGNQQRISGPQREIGVLDLAIGAGLQYIKLHSERASRAFAHLLRAGMGRLDEQRYAQRLRHQLAQKAQSLCRHFHGQGGDSRGIAARSIEARYEAQFDRWVRDQKVDRKVEVAALAATSAAVLDSVAITATCRRTRSAASSGNLSSSPPAQRNSIATVFPSTKPASLKPLRNPAKRLAFGSGEPACRNPITGSPAAARAPQAATSRRRRRAA